MSARRWLFATTLAASTAAAAAVLLGSTEARADWDPIMHRSDAGVDLYMWPWSRYSYRSAFAASAVPFVQFEPTDQLFINLRFPVGVGFDSTRFGLGNPTFAMWYSDIKGDLTWYVGGRASLPMGMIRDNGWRDAIYVGAGTMGFWDAWLWATDTLPFGALGGIEYRFTDWFVLRAGGDLGFYPSLRRGRQYGGVYRSNDFDVTFQARVDAEFQSRVGAGGGVSLMTWVIPTGSVDVAQTMAMPYFVYDSQKTFFMRAGFLLALDRPLGPAFDRGGLASLYLQFGGHLD